MKRLFLLIAVCMIGMVLPQGMWAETYSGNGVEIVVEGNTVTIKSTNAGALSTYLNSGNASAAIDAIQAANVEANGKVSSIVFDGTFKSDDLNALRDKSCCVQKTVDMSEAKFVKGAGVGPGQDEGPFLYKNEAAMNSNITVHPEKKDGDRCIVGGDKYEYTNSGSTYSWVNRGKDYTDNNRLNSLGGNNPQWYSVDEFENLPAPDGYAVALVGGTEYVFKKAKPGSQEQDRWVEASQAGDGDLDFNDMSFEYWGGNVTKAITSKYVDPNKPLPAKLCKGCTNLTDLTINSGTIHKIYEGNTKPPLQKVTIGNRVAQIGDGTADGGFGNFSSITEVAFDENGDDPVSLVFKGSSFISCSSLTGISFPARTTLIEANAFSTCNSLTTVTFKHDTQFTDPLIIRSMAFQNCGKIKDVYINVNSDEKLLICEYNAFSFDAMEAQTQVDGEMATLHFPEDTNDHPDNFDFYAGEWKKGMAFSQSELNSFKDGLQVTVGEQNYVDDNIVQNPDNFNFGGQNQGYTAIWKYNNIDGYYHPSDYPNTKYAPANGWQQFAKTASNREIEIIGNVYMTYSTATPYSLPNGIVAFRVTDYKYAEKNAKGYDTKGTLILKAINQVPTETGMLLISTDQYVVKNGSDGSVFFFGDPTGTPKQYHYNPGAAGDETSNYLAPAVHGIAVGPVSKGEPNDVTGAINVNGRPFTHRNFAMHKTSHKFVRLTHCTMPDNRAFLSLPITKFDNPDEGPGEGPTPTQTIAGLGLSLYDGYDPQPTSQGAKAAWVFDYDVEQYGMIWPLIKDEGLTGVTTGIKNVNVETVQEGIYTLQGVKVSAPSTKGIYIVNGKKVIIK